MTTTTDKGSAQQFVSSLPWTIDVLWQGKSGVHVIDDDRRATLAFGYSRTVGHYDYFDVTISSKTSGKIVNKWFRFDECLPRDERLDDQLPGTGRNEAGFEISTGYPIRDNPCFMVIDHCGWRWYIAVPTHPEKVTQAIEEWIDTWR